MNPETSPSPEDATEEVSALIETLLETGQRLEELTAGEVDTVAGRDGRTFLLRHAQEQLRGIEATKQAAILNALPANIALLDTQGRIVSVNEAWRKFGHANAVHAPGHGVGINYLATCNSARGENAVEAHQAAAGIRSVLSGATKTFSLEYPCHSPTERRWFLMTVTPLADDFPKGAVVMHLNITKHKRVYAMLSGINTLIVRVRDRNELFRESCRIAVEGGGFRMALIGIVDQSSMSIVPVASAGVDEAFLAVIKDDWSSSADASVTMAARVVREKTAAVSNNVQSDPRVFLAKQYTEYGVRSMAVMPLIIAEKIVGVFALYASEAEFFHADELKLLTELAGDIAFAIDHIKKQEQLDHLAYYDLLTGLANQTLFLVRLQERLLSVGNDQRKNAVFVLDIERFREINEVFGRSEGDVLLKQIAQRFVRIGGEASRFARIGADRFAITASGLDSVEQVGRYVEQRLEAVFHEPFQVSGKELRISVKVGIALFPDDATDADTLLRNAEAALKKAKSTGDRYLFFTPAMTARVAERLSMENKLRQAIEKDEFVLYYQPKVNLASGKVTSVEALIRWNDPQTGLVPPVQFIPLLEEIGLIHEVGRWALHKAIADYLRWRAAGLAAVRVAVNVSPLQLRDRNFVAEIAQAIGIDAQAAAGLELEITESLIMEDVKHSIVTLQAIRDRGVTIAIDDFGTGFSSLSYLAKLPVDTLKIDRSFVIDMTNGSEGLALVSTIINLAHALKLKVVAEGVDSEEQSRLLRLLNCDEMQGYLFSKPVPGGIFETRYLAAPPAGLQNR